MEAYLADFIAYLLTRQRVSPHTAAAYRRDVQQFLSFSSSAPSTHRSSLKNDELRALLVDFRDHLISRAISARSIARKLSSLRSFFRYIAERVPKSAIKSPEVVVGAPPRMERRLPRACTPADIAALIAAARAERFCPLRAELICTLLYSAGLRVSELLAIRREHIHEADRILTVTGKGGKMRTVPLVSETLRLLQAYEGESLKRLKERRSSRTSSLIRMDRYAVWRLIRRLAVRASIGRTVSPHMLRHSLATHSLQEGWDLRSLQKFLGHEKITTTEIYIHLNTQFIGNEYKKRHPRGRQ